MNRNARLFMAYKLKAKKWQGRYHSVPCLFLFPGKMYTKTQTSQEALRQLLSAHIFTQQLIRKTSEIIACLSLLGGAVKRSGPSYDSPLTYNLCSLAPNTPTSWYANVASFRYRIHEYLRQRSGDAYAFRKIP